jgi:hypothetical protein
VPEGEFSTLSAWYSAFQDRFPEYLNAPSAVVQSRISIALTRTPLDTWGAEYHTAGVLFLAAHLVAMSPGGEAMRLTGETTIYQTERNRLNRLVSAGYRIAGLP